MAVNQSTINILKQYSGGRELRFSQPTIIINNNTKVNQKHKKTAHRKFSL